MREGSRRGRVLGPALIAACAVTLVFPAGAASVPGLPGIEPKLPEACVLEPGELGRYIVVLHDWVEDPEPVAREQVERYGGSLGFIYGYALKGYSAAFPPEQINGLRGEPTVNYVQVDQMIWMDDSSGFIQWRSCPLAPPLEPLTPMEPPADSTPPSLSGEIAGLAHGDTQAVEASIGPQGVEGDPPVGHCGKGRVGRDGSCAQGRRRGKACGKRSGAAKRRCAGNKMR